MGSLFTPAIVCSSSKDGMAAVVADSSIEAGRDRSTNAIPIRATNKIAEIITRFMANLRFRALNVSAYLWEGSKLGQRRKQMSPSLTQATPRQSTPATSREQALVSSAGFGERDRNRLLYEIDQNSGGSASNNTG